MHAQGDIPGSLADVSCYGAESGMVILEVVHCCRILKFQASQGRETSLNTPSLQLRSSKAHVFQLRNTIQSEGKFKIKTDPNNKLNQL